MDQSQRHTPLDRLLRLFTDVRPGESRTVMLLTLNIFLILCAYYFIRPAREALILSVEGGPELKSYLSAVQAILLVGAVPLYGSLAGRFPRRRLINVVTAFFIACLGVFFILAQLNVPRAALGIAFFLWVGIFNLMVVTQFWSLANDVYTTDEGERLFPIVVVGASAGAVIGALVAGRLIRLLGNDPLFLFAGAVLIAAVLITNLLDARERRRKEVGVPDVLTTASMPAASGAMRLEDIRKALEEYDAREAQRSEEAEEEPEEKAVKPRVREGLAADITQTLGIARKGEGPFRMVFRSRYLLLIALFTMFLNWVNTTGEYILGSTVRRAADTAVAAGTAGGLTVEQFIGAFYSDFQFAFSLGGLLIQLFLVSRIFKYFGVRVAILVLPIIALIGYTILAFFPILAVVRWAKTAENATDYSLNQTVRNALFLPTTREEKYKAKQVTDAFFWRAGDVLSAVLVFVGVQLLSLHARQLAMVNLLLVAGMLGLAIVIGRRYQRLAAVSAT